MMWSSQFLFKKSIFIPNMYHGLCLITLHLFSSKLCKQPIAEQLGGQASHGGRDFSPN